MCVSSFQVLDVTTKSGQLRISGAVFVPELSYMSDGATMGWSFRKLRLGGAWGMDGVVLVAVGNTSWKLMGQWESSFLFLKSYFFTWAGPGLRCCPGFSLAVGSELLSSSGVRAFPSDGSSWGTRAPGHVGSPVAVPWLQSTGPAVVVRGLSCSVARGIFPDQGSNPCLLHGQVCSLSLSHQVSPEKSP